MPKKAHSTVELLLEDSPPFLSSADLVALGLFATRTAVIKARARGEAPPSFLVSKRKLRFPRDKLASWLDAKMQQRKA